MKPWLVPALRPAVRGALALALTCGVLTVPLGTTAETLPAQAVTRERKAGPSSFITSAPSAAAAHCSSTPFRSTPSKHVWFRIPAVVTTPTGTLVAFAERRDRNDSDDGDFDTVTARSTDRGCTWSAYRVIGDDGSNRVDNPAPLVDRTTGDIMVFSVVTARPGSNGKGKGLYLQTSTDDGTTFSGLLSGQVRPTGHYHGGLTGPGHGIQLTRTHAGRLIVPMGYRTSAGLYGAYAIYSDDHGATWQTGFDQQDTSYDVDFIEGTMAETASGDVFITFREREDNAVAGTARQYAISADGGESLRAPFARLPLKIVSVQASSLVPVGTHGDDLLLSAPADRTRNLRRDITVFVSRTGGTTWSRQYQVELESTPGSYSDLTQLDDSTIGVVYETGISTWKERIAFESIAIPALTDGAKVASRLRTYRSAHPTPVSQRARVQAMVTVKGISSPPGRVTVTFSGGRRHGSASIDLTYSNRGTRWITLPKLPAGSYTLAVTYAGTGRIARATASAGTLKVLGN